ncbi:hypothetical protein Aduo_009871 [Ancylostoma duodenale]
MSQLPGFNISNVNQADRLQQNQEHINRRVLNEYIRVVGIPNDNKKNPTELANFFLNEIVSYKNELDPYPLTWPTGTGSTGNSSSIRVKMSNAFWTYFTSTGRKRMYEFNRKNKVEVRVVRDKTLSLSDLDNLSLYLRKKIRDSITSNNLPHVDIGVKQGYITIANTKKFRATELAVRLGLNYSDWQGTPIQDLMSNTEKKLHKYDANFPPLSQENRKREANHENENLPPAKISRS